MNPSIADIAAALFILAICGALGWFLGRLTDGFPEEVE